jgi:hypothetical protein
LSLNLKIQTAELSSCFFRLIDVGILSERFLWLLFFDLEAAFGCSLVVAASSEHWPSLDLSSLAAVFMGMASLVNMHQMRHWVGDSSA